VGKAIHLFEVEVQMLSKNCGAVIRHLRGLKQKKDVKVIQMWNNRREDNKKIYT
jgi:hypothetical protein